MRKQFIICLIILILLTGCIKVKNPNCPVNQEPTISDSLVGQGTVTNIGSPQVKEPESPTKTKVDSTPIPEPSKKFIVKEVVAGDMVSFPNLDATDPDGESISYEFSSPLNARGEWQTSESDVGEYEVTITISDGKNKATQDVLIKVLPPNAPPTIQAPKEMAVQTGATLDIPIKVTDPENDMIELALSGWLTQMPYKVKDSDVGTHVVKIEASDGKNKVIHTVTITVTKQNSPPIIQKIDDLQINESNKVTITPQVRDADGDKVTITYSAPLDDKGSWTPTVEDEGKHEVFITADDGKDKTSTSFFIIVGVTNKAPIISGVKDLEVNEGDVIELTHITISDPEGDEVSSQISGYMNSTRKEVGYDDAGVHTVRVTATDGERSTVESFLVTVSELNRPPVFTPDAFE